jgi:hypothetical protein
MPAPPLVDSTQTVVGASAASRSRLTSHSASESIEGRIPPGTLLNGRYRNIALLGKGGVGEVYRAADLRLGQSAALEVSARAYAAQSGYPARPAACFSEFSGRTTMVEWLEKKPKLDSRKALSKDSPILLLPRQSPALLLANPGGPIGWNTPALNQTNSLRLQLGTNGRLGCFEAVPPIHPATPPASFDSANLFRATGLSPGAFTAIFAFWRSLGDQPLLAEKPLP